MFLQRDELATEVSCADLIVSVDYLLLLGDAATELVEVPAQGLELSGVLLIQALHCLILPMHFLSHELDVVEDVVVFDHHLLEGLVKVLDRLRDPLVLHVKPVAL